MCFKSMKEGSTSFIIMVWETKYKRYTLAGKIIANKVK